MWLALALLLLTSCSQITELIVEEIFIDYPIITRDLDSSWQESSSYEYTAEPEGQNYYKSPREMKHDGFGDCEDFSAFLCYQLGPESRFARIIRPRTMDTWDDPHGVVLYQGRYIEPQTYGKEYTDFYLVSDISYDAIMKLSTALYTK